MKINSSYLTILLILSISGCSSPSPSGGTNELVSNEQTTPYHAELKASFLDVYKVWQGVPYRLGGTSFNGIDCSAFVQVAFNDAMNFSLPRTTKQQVKVGSKLDYSQAQIGDLAFFKTSPNVRHVGIYVGNKQFMHASTSKGVIISRLDNPYWASKFWHFRRVISSPETIESR
tara:strand:- start:82 stop:600 length:519 start_codon:yes stop_codon:yes gene_type:complete